MSSINPDYKISSLAFLLDKSCVPERYFPLAEYKDILVSLGCGRKSDLETLPASKLVSAGFPEIYIPLLKRFLSLYDPKKDKFKEIEKAFLSPEEKAACRELFHLPGVKLTRAMLYYRAGYKTLTSVASATVEEIREKTASAIKEYSLSCIVPLPKEIRTHIAVAKAFTDD